MTSSNTRSIALAMLAPAALLGFASQARAHAHLMSANPAPNATVAAGVKAIALHFNEAPMARFSGVDLMAANGAKVAAAPATVIPNDRKTLMTALKAPLARGAYKVSWRAVTADTHRVQGSYSFKVR